MHPAIDGIHQPRPILSLSRQELLEKLGISERDGSDGVLEFTAILDAEDDAGASVRSQSPNHLRVASVRRTHRAVG